MRVGFLLNHEGAHQIAHALPIAFSLARIRRDIGVDIFVAPGSASREARRIAAGADIPANCRFVDLNPASFAARLGARLTGNIAPLERLSVLRRNVPHFRQLSALIVPEKTSLLLKSRLGLSHLRLIHTRHGAGDRAVGFDKASGDFDFVLLPGRKVRDRLANLGLLRDDRHAVVGYPKFDCWLNTPRRRFFDNDRPTVLYNPHPSPALSSWYAMGHDVLEYFARNQDYNLIFAPHVMLFAKRLSVSLNPPSIRYVPGVPDRYRNLPNILIDTGSEASVDMSYAIGSDIYLGDASSQVYEFLANPRPCIFLNPQRAQWRGNPDFAHWQSGPVVERIDQLDAVLDAATRHPDTHVDIQRELFSYSFDLAPIPSADRAAHAISAFLEKAEAPIPQPRATFRQRPDQPRLAG